MSDRMLQFFVGVATALVSTLFGFWISEWKSSRDRKRRLKTHWASLLNELEICHEKASIVFESKIAAPLFRLPIEAYQTSIPVILSEDEIDADELHSLVKFFSTVQDLNRGLEMARHLHMEGKGIEDPLLIDIANRNKLYARDLCITENQIRFYVDAKYIIQTHLKK